MVVDIKTMGSRIYVSDVNESLLFLTYKARPKYIRCRYFSSLHYLLCGSGLQSRCCGNAAVIKLPNSVSEDHEDYPSSFWDRGYLYGASQKVGLYRS